MFPGLGEWDPLHWKLRLKKKKKKRMMSKREGGREVREEVRSLSTINY